MIPKCRYLTDTVPLLRVAVVFFILVLVTFIYAVVLFLFFFFLFFFFLFFFFLFFFLFFFFFRLFTDEDTNVVSPDTLEIGCRCSGFNSF